MVKISQDSLRKGSYYLTMSALDSELQVVREMAVQKFLQQRINGAASVIAASYSGDHVFAPDIESVKLAHQSLKEASLILGHNEEDAGLIRMEAIRNHLMAMDVFTDKTSLSLKLFGESPATLAEEDRLRRLEEEKELELIRARMSKEEILLKPLRVRNPIKFGE